MITWNSGLSAKLLFNPKTWGFHFFTEGGPDGYGFQFWFLVVHFTYWSDERLQIEYDNNDIVKSFCCNADVIWDYTLTKINKDNTFYISGEHEPIYLCSECKNRVNDAGGKFID